MWIVKDYIHQKVSSVLKNLFTSLKGSKRVLMHQMYAPLLVQRLNKWYLINHINNKKTMNFSYKNGEKLNHSSLRAWPIKFSWILKRACLKPPCCRKANFDSAGSLEELPLIQKFAFLKLEIFVLWGQFKFTIFFKTDIFRPLVFFHQS
jgi:hypothetical protein